MCVCVSARACMRACIHTHTHTHTRIYVSVCFVNGREGTDSEIRYRNYTI